VKTIVHSSTAATYGEPDTMPIVEDTPQAPINPYGQSKLMVEHMLRDYAAAHDDFAFAILRYFNVAGSDPEARIGEDHDPETHIIPVLLEAASGKRDKAYIFGDDYRRDRRPPPRRPTEPVRRPGEDPSRAGLERQVHRYRDDGRRRMALVPGPPQRVRVVVSPHLAPWSAPGSSPLVPRRVAACPPVG